MISAPARQQVLVHVYDVSIPAQDEQCSDNFLELRDFLLVSSKLEIRNIYVTSHVLFEL